MTPSVLRLSDRDLVRTVTGFSSRQLRSLASTDGCPVRFRGEGKGRREFVIVREFEQWLEARSGRVA